MSKAVKFLSVRQAFRAGFKDVNAAAWELFERIIVLRYHDVEIRIMEAMQLGTGSPASIHRYIDLLRANDLLDVKMLDGRTKWLILGPQGERYVQRLNRVEA